MAAARCLCWGLRRAGTWLLPPPVCCPQRVLHKQADGTEFQSIYSLDKLYPESRGSDTAWRVPVSGEGRTEGAFPLCGDVRKPGLHWPGWSKLEWLLLVGRGGGRGRELVAGASGAGAADWVLAPGGLGVCGRLESTLSVFLAGPPAFPSSIPGLQAQMSVAPKNPSAPQENRKQGFVSSGCICCQPAMFGLFIRHQGRRDRTQSVLLNFYVQD